MKNEELIGRKFRGFSFEGGKYNGLSYDFLMDEFIGVELVITSVTDLGFVKSDSEWSYPLEQVKKHLIPENEVIKVLNEEHGKKVIQYWKSRGVDTGGRLGNISGQYYGVINGEFRNVGLGYVTNSKVKIITLPEDKPEIKWVWVRDTEDEEWMKYIFIADIGDQFTNRYIVVGSGDEIRHQRGDKDIRITVFSQITYTDPNPNEEIEKEIKELENQIEILKQKLCK